MEPVKYSPEFEEFYENRPYDPSILHNKQHDYAVWQASAAASRAKHFREAAAVVAALGRTTANPSWWHYGVSDCIAELRAEAEKGTPCA